MRKKFDGYDDLINIKWPQPSERPRMSMRNRAAQFAPFAALHGHKDAVDETSRITEKKKILDNDIKAIINYKLQEIQNDIKSYPLIKVKYFQQDVSKDGGRYLDYKGKVKKIDTLANTIIFLSDKKISFNDIYSIEY